MALKQRVELAALALVAATALAEGVRIMIRHRASLRAFEAGGYLVILGALLAALGVVYALRAPAERWQETQGGRRVLVAVALLVAYALALPVLGYLLSTALALVAYLRAFSAYGWAATLAFASAVAVATAWLWRFLVVILPPGVLPWP
jgi:hypothetical protein